MDGGIEFVVIDALVASDGGATKVNAACKLSNERTIEAWFLTLQENQGSPADSKRLISISSASGAPSQNFHFSQTGKDYEVTIRTVTNGSNNLYIADAAASRLAHVVAVRRASGQAEAFHDGVQRATLVTTGDLSNWDDGYRLCLGNVPTVDRGWLGRLHLVAVYGRALSAGEIAQNFAAGP